MSKRFTPQEDQTVKDLHDMGFSFPQIAKRMGRSEEGVRFRYQIYETRGGAGFFGPFSEEEDSRLLDAYKQRRSLLDLSVELNRPVIMLRKRLDTIKGRLKRQAKESGSPPKGLRREISADPAHFPDQANKHLEAILREDPRGFAAYTSTNNPRVALGVVLPLTWRMKA